MPVLHCRKDERTEVCIKSFTIEKSSGLGDSMPHVIRIYNPDSTYHRWSKPKCNVEFLHLTTIIAFHLQVMRSVCDRIPVKRLPVYSSLFEAPCFSRYWCSIRWNLASILHFVTHKHMAFKHVRTGYMLLNRAYMGFISYKGRNAYFPLITGPSRCEKRSFWSRKCR